MFGGVSSTAPSISTFSDMPSMIGEPRCIYFDRFFPSDLRHLAA